MEATKTEKKWLKRMPKGMRRGFDDTIACIHRDVSCCPECEATYANIVDGQGVHYWLKDQAELDQYMAVREDIANGMSWDDLCVKYPGLS